MAVIQNKINWSCRRIFNFDGECSIKSIVLYQQFEDSPLREKILNIGSVIQVLNKNNRYFGRENEFGKVKEIKIVPTINGKYHIMVRIARLLSPLDAHLLNQSEFRNKYDLMYENKKVRAWFLLDCLLNIYDNIKTKPLKSFLRKNSSKK